MRKVKCAINFVHCFRDYDESKVEVAICVINTAGETISFNVGIWYFDVGSETFGITVLSVPCFISNWFSEFYLLDYGDAKMRVLILTYVCGYGCSSVGNS